MGELGNALLSRLTGRIERGDFGPVMPELAHFTPAASPTRVPTGNIPGRPGMPGSPSMTPGMQPWEKGMMPGMPPGAQEAVPDSPIPPGGMPPMMPGMPPMGKGTVPGMPPGGKGMVAGWPRMPPGEEEMMPGMAGWASAEGARNPNSLTMGVTLLGEGTSKVLLETANRQGIDVLVMFEVEVSENRKTGYVTNETRIVVWDVGKQQELVRTRALNNIAVQKLRGEKGKVQDDPVAAALDKLFDALDSGSEEALKVSEFPAEIRPEHVLGRIEAMLSSQDEELLPKLAEIKFYHHRGLIDDGTFAKSLECALGDEGVTLATGDEEARLAVIGRLLPSDS